MSLKTISDQILTFDFPQKIMPGVTFPARSTILCLENQELVIISPGPFDDSSLSEIKERGNKFYLVAPNLFHHFYAIKVSQQLGNAPLYGPHGLGRKVKDLKDRLQSPDQLPETIRQQLEGIPIKGHKLMQEWVFYHRPSKTLICTDLIFNIKNATGLTGLVLSMAKANRQVAQSRLVKFTVTDKDLMVASVKALKKLPLERVIPAHGEIVEDMSLWNKFLDEYRL